MAEERKKPKIDLKSRIPSKTVKGLTPAAGGVIPPPPGAVPAPPPDLLGRRSMPPQVSADPNDPLGAATVTGGSRQPQQQQIVVVQAAEEGGVGAAAGKKGVLYAMIGGALVVGLGLGFVIGGATKGNEVKSKAVNDAKELSAKVAKTDENLQKFLDTLKGAQSELQNSAQLSQATIDAIKGWSSGFTTADLKTREIAFFGEETAGRLLTYAQKVNHIDELRAGLTKAGGLESANAQIKAFSIPKGAAKWGVKVSKPGGGPNEPLAATADLVDLGDPVVIGDKGSYNVSGKETKLKVKSGELDVFGAGSKDFFEKGYVAPVEGKDWLKACPVYAQAIGYTKQSIDELVVAIEGAGDDAGTLKPGKDLEAKLKSLAK
ncbi:MAG: hypothetical protein ACXWUG_19080 [Polyangiales bacterium]